MLSRWFRRNREGESSESLPGYSGPKVPRHSGGWAALRKRLEKESGLHVIDVGFPSAANLQYLTGLGHNVFLTDLVRDACTGDWQRGADDAGKPIWDVDGFLAESLNVGERKFDVILLWTSLDYLPEPFVAPLVTRLFEITNPDGQVLALFHTRIQGEESTHCRCHVAASDEIEIQRTQQFPLQRAFSNRSIQNLFSNWSGHRQFLAKDSVSELIITR